MSNFKHIRGALHLSNCKYLTNYLKQCIANGSAVKDDQCPDSYSVGHDAIVDKLLEEFLPRMEQETGKKLFPTYAYARHYIKGDRLLCHTDRPACEYSATITLGFNKDVWHLYVADPGGEDDLDVVGEYNEKFKVTNVHRINMDVGDAVIYKGCVAPHWRYEFDESDWQTQIFLHYVDQDGPNAEWKYDKRPCLAHHDAPVVSSEDDEEILYWYVPNAISSASCDQMIEKFESAGAEKACVGGISSGTVNLKIRDVNKLQITNEIGIGATLTGMGLNINSRAWKFDITNSNQTEFLSYDEYGHYDEHVDTHISTKSDQARKVTVLAFLNDDFEGGRFFINNGGDNIYPPQEKGTVIAFPSFMHHGVEPVKSGIRRSIVTWLVGPWFK